MRIGACGIACEVCGLYADRICPGCGPGTAEFNKERIETLREMGVLCPVLECAVNTGIDYCSRDCGDFPCSRYKEDPFPYSHAYLEMYVSRKAS
jgi:hypothetical protein